MTIQGRKKRVLVVVVITPWGEFVLMRENPVGSTEDSKWMFPISKKWSIGGMQQRATDTIETFFGIRSDTARLSQVKNIDPILSDDDGQPPIILFCYVLSWNDYQTIFGCNIDNLKETEGKLETSKYTNHEIWLIDKTELLRRIETQPHRFHKSTLTILKERWYRNPLLQLWNYQVSAFRREVLDRILKVVGERIPHRLDDTFVMDLVIPKPKEPATSYDVEGVLKDGKNTLHGAYQIGNMMRQAMRLEQWGAKLSNPFDKYVRQELSILERVLSLDGFDQTLSDIVHDNAVVFVRDILHFPLEGGSCFRNHLTNLEEITACRYALRMYLRSLTDLPPSAVENPISSFNDECNRIVAELWRELRNRPNRDPKVELESIAKLSILLDALDFHSPDFYSAWGDTMSIRKVVKRQFERVDLEAFSSSLGGDAFFKEFIRRITPNGDGSDLLAVYFTDNNGQLVASLKFVETALSLNPGLKVILVPKNGSHWNDASWSDVEKLLEADASHDRPIFKHLRGYRDQERFDVCRHGPETHGLHPAHISKELCYFLRQADLVLTEGQAYAEIRGWLKPTYLMFQVNGRMAEAIHGVDRVNRELAFVRVGFGVNHYDRPLQLLQRTIGGANKGQEIHVFGQTTTDYVMSLLSLNYAILKNKFHGGDEAILNQRLREEMEKGGRNISEIVLGRRFPHGDDTTPYRDLQNTDVFAIGGGGGFNQVTLKALKDLGCRVAAGVPSTDDGGSTGKIQDWIEEKYGYIFGMGDAAVILEQQVGDWGKIPILSFRPSVASDSFVDTITEHIIEEIANPSVPPHNLTDCDDWLTFACGQLNLARTIDKVFLGRCGPSSFSIKGASVRNLNILSAFYQCGALTKEENLRFGGAVSHEEVSERAESAWNLLDEALGINMAAHNFLAVLPVTYERSQLWARYKDPIPENEIRRLGIQDTDLSEDLKLVFRQRNIDQIVHESMIVEFGCIDRIENRYPAPNPYYLAALKASRLFVMGAGSLYSSQLAQLAIPEVMEAIIRKDNSRKVLVINHVRMNETNAYSLSHHIRAIEDLANTVVPPELKSEFDREIQIGDIFSDIIIPRTVAREIDIALEKEANMVLVSKHHRYESIRTESKANPVFVDENGSFVDKEKGIYLNRYVAYVLDHPEFRRRHKITDWELRILGFLEQEQSLYSSRSEAGRYRGAVYALPQDIEYLVFHGIPHRNIYEVESIAMNTKVLKAEGKPRIETFPGLIPEALVGVFKILLAKGVP